MSLYLSFPISNRIFPRRDSHCSLHETTTTKQKSKLVQSYVGGYSVNTVHPFLYRKEQEISVSMSVMSTVIN